jgi:hypothetical protein
VGNKGVGGKGEAKDAIKFVFEGLRLNACRSRCEGDTCVNKSRRRRIGGAVPRAWLPIEYPPTCTSSQYMGPLTVPARYWIEKFDWVATPEIDGSY